MLQLLFKFQVRVVRGFEYCCLTERSKINRRFEQTGKCGTDFCGFVGAAEPVHCSCPSDAAGNLTERMAWCTWRKAIKSNITVCLGGTIGEEGHDFQQSDLTMFVGAFCGTGTCEAFGPRQGENQTTNSHGTARSAEGCQGQKGRYEPINMKHQ